MTTLSFTIPPELWLTANRHSTNRGHRKRQVDGLHTLADLAARGHAPLTSFPVGAVWTIRYPKGVRVDKGEADNAQPTCKALLDGLVSAGLIPDDGPPFVAWSHYRRGPNLTIPRAHEVALTFTDQEVPW